MKKITIFLAAILGMNNAVDAQINSSNISATGRQTVQLALSNALEISFVGRDATTGDALVFAFTNPDHYANGIESTEQELRVRSNKNFGDYILV